MNKLLQELLAWTLLLLAAGGSLSIFAGYYVAIRDGWHLPNRWRHVWLILVKTGYPPNPNPLAVRLIQSGALMGCLLFGTLLVLLAGALLFNRLPR